MRGEDHSVAPGEEVEEGSPPHARGRPAAQAGRASACRITPACAGKTLRPPAATSRRSDHPRMRGEDMGIPKGHVASRGSPPHARGRRIAVCIAVCIGGITPACAGKTHCCLHCCLHRRDHPRMRGEDPVSRSGIRSHGGSPPHARGRLEEFFSPGFAGRITPACAGKTGLPNGHQGFDLDHPRMRGEDSRRQVTVCAFTGSPPHARGRLVVVEAHGAESGITPACAGKT